MVLDDDAFTVRIKDAAIFIGILFDDRKVGDDNDNATQIMLSSVRERERHARESFAAACWYCQIKEALRKLTGFNALIVNTITQADEFTRLIRRRFLQSLLRFTLFRSAQPGEEFSGVQLRSAPFCSAQEMLFRI